MKQQANISIFVPHSGCPNQCSFCNQHTISGAMEPTTPEQVRELCRTALPAALGRFQRVEIAFFGGSFTAIDRSEMTALLEAASPFVGPNGADGIRVSTRPDAIDRQVLALLKYYGVTAVELGSQSMDDRVLRLNQRGHTAQDTLRAAALIQEYSFCLGLQMMTGLYGDTMQGALETARQIAALHPDTVRVYPTVVLRNTLLARLYESGEYTPPGLEESLELLAQLLELFGGYGVEVIRMGLHASEGVEQGMLAGCYHPALRELAEGRLLFDKIIRFIEENHLPAGRITIHTAPGARSALGGHHRKWLSLLEQRGYYPTLHSDSALAGFELRIAQEIRPMPGGRAAP